MSSANVTSLDVLRRLRSALIVFAEECNETMVGIDMELRRGLQWLLDEQPKYWKHEERRWHDRVLEARQELSRARGMAMKGENPSCSEQKKAIEQAVAQLRHAEEKSKITKHWGRVIDHDAQEWQGRANQFTNTLEGELPKALALLDRAITALEGYLSATTSASGGAGERENGRSVAKKIPLESPTPPFSPSPTPASIPPSPEAVDASR